MREGRGSALTRLQGEVTQRRYDRQERYDLKDAPMGFRASAGGGQRRVGGGVGRNLPYHPPKSEVSAIDISSKLLAKAARKAQKNGRPWSCLWWTPGLPLSTVFARPRPAAVGCVLKPAAAFLEHVRLKGRILGWLMDRLNPLWVRLSGANINRDTVGNVAKAGFEVVAVDSHMGGLVKLIEARKGV
jgi:hypothetical protein